MIDTIRTTQTTNIAKFVQTKQQRPTKRCYKETRRL